MSIRSVLANRCIVLSAIFTLGIVAGSPAAFAQDNTGSSDAMSQLLGQLVESLAPPAETPEEVQGTQENQEAQVVRGVCESKDLKRAYCRVNTAGGVRLLRQLSRSPCEDNWGYDDEGIWVDKGCRAEFEVRILPEAPTPVPTEVAQHTTSLKKITCESKDGRRAFCSADTSVGVKLVRTLSSTPCAGKWGYDSSGIWVDGGCRAEFEVSMPEATPTPKPVPVAKMPTVECRSSNGRKVFCPADTSGGVRLVRRLGQASCQDNWGFNDTGIWVDKGCQAEFELGKAARHPSPTEVTCRSLASKRQYCKAPVTTSIRLVKVLSQASCLGNWGFGEKGLWVRKGCQATFEVE